MCNIHKCFEFNALLPIQIYVVLLAGKPHITVVVSDLYARNYKLNSPTKVTEYMYISVLLFYQNTNK